jgi:glutamate dehydrogenase
VQAHLREAGRIVDDPVVVVGAGDMTDQFFAAGMVQSPAIRLRAAVSRRYFFLDPDPDPEASLGERRRLAQQRLGWEAYDATKLSKGGMILARTATRVQLSPEARGLLGLDAHEVSSEQLAEAILGAEADVLWAGAGAAAIATPRRAPHARTVPALVLGPPDVRAAVIAESDASALDPKARVEFARTGVRVNSYAIDGIADADFGDHEATLKILLAVVQADGAVTDGEREAILRDAVGHVVPRVLARVRAAHRALSYDERRARVHGLEYLDAIAEARATDGVAAATPKFPDAVALATRRAGGPIITRPALGVLLACGKRALREDLLAAAAPLDGPAFERFLIERFSRAIHERFRNAVRAHPLGRELVAAELATEIVDTMGAAFVRRLGRDFHARPAAIAHAWMTADALADGPSLRAALWTGPAESSAPNDANASVALYDALATALERLTVWVLEYTAAQPGADPIAEFGRVAEALRRRLPMCFSAPEAERFHRRAAALDMAGDRANLAQRLALAEALADGFDLVAIAAGIHAPWESIARLYYAAGDWLEYAWIERQIARLDADDPWRRRAAFALGQDLRAARRTLVGRLGTVGATVADVQAGGCAGETGESLAVEIRALRGSGRGDLAALAVVVRELGRLGDAIRGG